MFRILVSFILGILSYDFVNVETVILISFCLIIANLLMGLLSKTKRGHYSFLIIVFLIGSMLSFYYQSSENRGLYQFEDKFVEISGYVYEIPQKQNDLYTYIIKTDGVKYKQKTYNIGEYVKLTTDKKLKYAQEVGVKGFLEPILRKRNHNEFDFARYYKSKEVFYGISEYKVISNNNIRKEKSLKYYQNSYKNKIIDFIDKRLDNDRGAILKAITTGIKSDFSPEYEDLLLKTNTRRMLYPSYMHILIILSLANLFLPIIGKKYRDYVAVFMLLSYALFFSQGVVGIKNATLYALIILSIRWLGYKHYPDVLSTVLVGILCSNPLIIYNCGFVISVVIGWLFFMIREPVYNKLKFIKNRYLRDVSTLYLISTIGIIPLSAYYFNVVSIYGMLLNFIYFPMLCLHAVAFILMILETTIFGVAFIGGYMEVFFTEIFYRLPFFVAKLPLSYINLGKPTVSFIISFYLVAIIIKDFYYKKRFSQRSKMVATVILGMMIVNITTGVMNLGKVEIDFINVGQGDGALIRLPHGANIIVDGGGSEEYSDFDVGENIFVPYLKSEGVYRIDMAILSHYHKDHCQGVIRAMKELNVQAVMMPYTNRENKYKNEIEKIADNKNIKIIYPAENEIYKIGNAEIEIISAGNDFSENDESIVFVFKYNDFDALFTGDMTKHTENTYLDKFYDVELLKVAHHGSDTSSSEEFLDKVSCEIAVISVGEDNMYLLPDNVIVNRLKRRNVEIFRTDEMGDIRFWVLNDTNIICKTYY